jgi:signal transduction histidine kinase
MSAPEKVNILLVDDQPARLLSYCSILEELNQNLITASSGSEALNKVMKQEFAVILLDVSMPGIDGFETASLIHEHPRYERTPIIFVTGVHMTELDRLKGYKLGAVDYVHVPVVPEILRSKVAVLVELHFKRRELQRLNRSLEEANRNLERMNSTLQAEKARELERLNRDLTRANAEFEAANRALASEVDERRRAEQALRAADRQKNEFIAILAHELRNPLAPIHNALQIMQRVRIDNAQVATSRDIIERQSKHLSRLVDDLLDVSRITNGRINLQREPVDVATFVSRAIEANQPLLAERRHSLVVEPSLEPLRVQGDSTRLTQIVGNLINNAAKFTEPGGHIVVSTRRRDDSAEVCVRDDGIGIPTEKIADLFELFTQGPRGDEQPHSGLGIGLALARRLVEMHGGNITVRSDGSGYGSEFIVRLPIASAAAGTGPDPADAVGLATDVGSRHRILIADDNRDALESLETLLTLDGHTVFTALDGEQALALANEHRPEIALLDIGMGKLDGYAVARGIRGQDWGAATTLVAITGWGQDGDRRRSGEAGFDLHLVKPVEFDAIRRILEALPPRTAVSSSVTRHAASAY